MWIHTSVVYFKKRCDHKEMQLQQVTVACNDKTPSNLPLPTLPLCWQPFLPLPVQAQTGSSDFRSAEVSGLCSFSCRDSPRVTPKGLKSHRPEGATSLLAMRAASVLKTKFPVPCLRKTPQELGLRKESSKWFPVFPVCLCQASFHWEKRQAQILIFHTDLPQMEV